MLGNMRELGAQRLIGAPKKMSGHAAAHSPKRSSQLQLSAVVALVALIGSALLSALTRLLLLLVGALATTALLLTALVLTALAALMLTALASALILILVRHLVFLSNDFPAGRQRLILCAVPLTH
jgi:hypothetical protein